MVQLHRSTAHHPETDGAVERTNQLLEQPLRCVSSSVGADWVRKLPGVSLSLNINVSSSTKFSPAQLMFGYTPRSILDIEFPSARDTEPASVTEMLDKMRFDLQDAQKNLAEAKTDQKHFADRHRRDVPSFNNGDLVLLSSKHLRLTVGDMHLLREPVMQLQRELTISAGVTARKFRDALRGFASRKDTEWFTLFRTAAPQPAVTSMHTCTDHYHTAQAPDESSWAWTKRVAHAF